MDPEARVVVTAHDATAAAFNSADRNLKQFQRSLTGMKSLMASFGVIFSARAFISWIDGAVRAADATGEHAAAIKATKETIEAMKKASDALALSIADGLTPAMKGVTAVLLGWNRIASGADPVPFEKEIDALQKKIDAIKGTNINPRDDGRPVIVFTSEQKAEIDALKAALDELIKKQEIALGLRDDRSEIAARIAVKNMRRIGDVYAKFSGLKRPEIELDELLPLDGLEEIVVDARQMTVDELLKPFPSAEVAKMFKPIEEEAGKAAEFMGETFRDAFTDWILGTERDFKELLKRMATEMAVSGIFDAFASMFSGGTSGFAKFMSSFFGGARGSGGPVSSGKGYLVGEHGPEMFFPGQSGMIAANGGGLVYNDYSAFTVSGGGDSRESAAAIKGMFAAHKRDVMSSIQDLMRRGRFG